MFICRNRSPQVSGIYDPPTAEPSDLVRAYYGDDDYQFAQRSPIPGLVACPVPMLLAVAEFDTADFHRPAVTLLDAMLAAHGVIPPFVTIPDHNHQSEIFSIGLDDDAFGSTLARFAHRVTASRSDSAGARVATTR